MQRIIPLMFLLLGFSATAQNTGGVFGPVVNAGHRSMEYRFAYDEDSEAWAQRLHYQQSINGELMWRIIGATRKTAQSDTDFDFVQGELFWQLTPDSSSYQSGLRFDVRLRDNDRANQFGVNWMNQFSLADQWQARLILLTSIQVGDNAADGVAIGTRGSIYKKFAIGQVGLEMYSSYGSTEKFKSLDDQSHSIGPFITGSLGIDRWSYFAGVLVGVTDAAPDTELRFRLTTAF
ncbi:MAG: hypothetical protein GW763_17970 [Paraglaciecola sp.]|nr:hypothetical protein [Paraglaciecola sp.]NCT49843.1 hypothetical protein [Paraglaciecola sp.]